MQIKYRLTNRGFKLATFKDSYGMACRLQESSSLIPHIWLGDNLTEAPVDPLSGQYIGATMHLNQEQVAALIPHLQYFVLHGKLPERGSHDS